ncbi:MAG: potassium channel family protein [Christensenellales bacterium]
MEKKTKIMEKMKDFVVIGINRLGSSVASHLFAMGNEVLAIDKNQQRISNLGNKVSTAVTTDASSYEVLHSLGVQNFDCAIVCINNDLQGSLLSAQNCKDLGVKYIIATAQSEQHARILNALGVDLIIYPEEFVGSKLASMLSKPGINELVELTDEFKIFEMKLPDVWANKQIQDINIRKKYKLSIVFIKRDKEVLSPEPEMELKEGDTLVVAGEISKINAVANLINDASDIEEQLNSVFSNN